MATLSFLLLLLLLVLVCYSLTMSPSVVMGCIEREREALLHFKHGLMDNYGVLSSWRNTTTSDCCQWRGVRCSNNRSGGHVIELHLPAPGWSADYSEYKCLSGEIISPSLAELKHLTHLDLSHNDFESTPIPLFLATSIPNLQYLNLSTANFAGPVPLQLGNLSNLLFLDLSSNYDLSFENLECLSHLSSLRHLDLSYLNLSKAVHWSHSINKLPSLVHLNLRLCSLPPLITAPFLSLDFPIVNSSAPLAVLDLSWNPFDLTSSIYPWLFNFSTTLVHLDLSWCNLGSNGSIPETFGSMVSLTHLDLHCNHLHGPIPSTVGNLTSLEQLDLSHNNLEGELPKSLCNLCHLEELYLGVNNLSGQLSQVWDSLACTNDKLYILYLPDGQFTGSIPDLTRFPSLRNLVLDHNQLNGTLPTSIGQLTKLEILIIGSNLLQGSVSEAHFLRLSLLFYLDLSFNSLTFNMSSKWVPPFQLNYISLTSCELGSHFPSWLRTQRKLEYLDISNSEISDVIPNWFWNLTSSIAFLNISNNQLRGALPDLSSKFDHPYFIDMSSNNLGGSIPQLPSDLTWLDLSNNKFSGSISSICAASHSYLVHLDLSNNFLSGELPNCQSQWRSLITLNMEDNQFFGKIPNSFGSLQSIRSLHLRNNSLIGELPSTLKKCKSLSFVDLAKNNLFGEIPPWIGSLINLQVLNLRSNNFNGSISSDLCQLKKIQILDLSSNNIIGTIPRCLSKFSAMAKKGSLTIAYNYGSLRNSFMTYTTWNYVDKELVKWKGREYEYKNTLGLVKSIDLSSNNFTGEIPKEVTDLLELVSLNFSRNNLTGLIPTSIGQMKSLEVLDLSRNQLIGEIPISLSGIDRLSTLDLSNNNLSGKIPRGTQLQGFTSSYEGNPSLCGLPLLKKCPTDSSTGAPSAYNYESSNEQDESDMWFYISIALGFIIGFWGICGTLLLNNSWRHAYFRLLNKVKCWFYVTATINMARLRRSFKIKRFFCRG